YLQQKSLRSLIRLTLGGVFVASFLIIALTISVIIYNSERNEWRARHNEAAQSAAQRLSLFLDRTRQTLTSISLLDHHNPEYNSTIMQFLLSYEDPATLIEVIRTDRHGQILGSAYRDAPLLADRLTIPQSNWFVTARQGQVYLGGLQIAPN